MKIILDSHDAERLRTAFEHDNPRVAIMSLGKTTDGRKIEATLLVSAVDDHGDHPLDDTVVFEDEDGERIELLP